MKKQATVGFVIGFVSGAVMGILYGQGVRERTPGAIETNFKSDGTLQIEVDTVKAATPTLVGRLLR